VQFTELWRRANFTDRLLVIYFAMLAVAIAIRHDRVEGWPWYVGLHTVILALIAGLVRRGGHGHAWYPLAIPLIAFPEAAQLHDLFVDDWRDHYILAFEESLFAVPPTVWFTRWSAPAFSELVQLGYLSYFLFLPLVAAMLYLRTDRTPFFTLMAATMLGYVVCYAVFLIFPTEGPARTLRHLHTQPLPSGPLLSIVLFIQQAGTHGNAFPSAHVVGAVVPVIFAWRYVPALAAWLLPLLPLMCVGAVYDRYHYASDILGGVLIGAAAAWALLEKSHHDQPPMSKMRQRDGAGFSGRS
jgi:membrane-associated phospholipid phosphatase